MKKINVVCIGGGTGMYTLLTGIKKYNDVNLSVIVSMMDSGGSNRVIRDEFGLLPTSDLRQCIVAMADEDKNEILRKLFTYRYHQGTGISGMTFGNLFMAALTDIYGSQKEAIKQTNELMEVKGNIFPVTFDNVHLIASYDNGKKVLGEHYIDEADEWAKNAKIQKLSLIPEARLNSDAILAIKEAHYIILGPGDLYTSIICNLLVGTIKKVLLKSKAKIIFIMNLMTKFGQTQGMSASFHVKIIEKYLGARKLDYIFVNNNTKYSSKIISRYLKEKSQLVKDDLKDDKRVVRADLVSNILYKNEKSDTLFRSLVRHDSQKLAKSLYNLFRK